MASDAVRFVLTFRMAIEIAPLQVYSSALIFSPRRSTARDRFWHHLPDWIEATPAVSEDWDSTLQVLNAHTNNVNDVRFSPDGKLLASGADDRTVRLWDPATGTCRSTLEGHSDYVRSVAFSPDGKLLASGADDRTVRLWDPATGTCRSTLEGHSVWVSSVAFLPGGKLLRSTDIHGGVLLWDVEKGKVFEDVEARDAPSLSVFTGHDLEANPGLAEAASGTLEESRLATTSSFPLHVSKGWILLGERKLLLLPPNRGEVECFECSGSVVAIGHRSGVVSFVGFDVNKIP